MASVELDHFMAVNDLLRALAAADVPLDMGLGKSADEIAANLDRVNATVARESSRGVALSEAISASAGAAPAKYRSLIQLGLRSGNLPQALGYAQEAVARARSSRFGDESGFYYPLLVCCLVYLGTMVFCQFVVPSLAAMYVAPDSAPGPALRAALSLRATLPIWAVVWPAVVIVFVVWPRWSRPGGGSFLGWLAGSSSTARILRQAAFAELAADSLESGAQREDAIRWAAEASGEGGLAKGTGFPPLLQWALCAPDAEPNRGLALRTAAEVYRETAEWRASRRQAATPVLALIVLGGGATLLYGLMLFVPAVELLRALVARSVVP